MLLQRLIHEWNWKLQISVQEVLRKSTVNVFKLSKQQSISWRANFNGAMLKTDDFNSIHKILLTRNFPIEDNFI